MKIKLNQRLTEDRLGDVVDDFGVETAKEAQKAAQKMSKLGALTIESDNWADPASGDVERALSNSLEIARENQAIIEASADDDEPISPKDLEFAPNVLIVGPAGTGKTARIKAWCRQNGITMVFKDAKTMDPSDLGGIISRQVDDAGNQTNTATKLTNTEFDVLDTPDTILFLDELNRAPSDVAGSLLTLIQDHSVVDHDSPTGYRVLEGFLFTVAAINPSSGEDAEGYDTNDLDMAMKTRFGTVSVEYDNMQQLQYLKNKYNKLISNTKLPDNVRLKNYNRYQIAKTLLTSPLFHFDTEEEEAELAGTNDAALNYRSLSNLLQASDGTKEDFLDKWSQFCNPHKLDLVENILDDYVDQSIASLSFDAADKNDKANSVFQDGENPFAQRQESAWDKLSSML